MSKHPTNLLTVKPVKAKHVAGSYSHEPGNAPAAGVPKRKEARGELHWHVHDKANPGTHLKMGRIGHYDN